MPKPKNKLTQKEQSERFKKAVAELADAGELNPTEAEAKIEKIFSAGVKNQQKTIES